MHYTATVSQEGIHLWYITPVTVEQDICLE